MNYGRDGYVIEHLLKAALKHHAGALVVDLLTGDAEPEALLTRPVRESISRYSLDFPKLVRRSGSDARFVTTATLRMKLGVDKPLQTSWLPAGFHYRIECAVDIVSDQGRRYAACLKEMWPGPLPRPRLVIANRGT